jgi:hypothetical protein
MLVTSQHHKIFNLHPPRWISVRGFCHGSCPQQVQHGSRTCYKSQWYAQNILESRLVKLAWKTLIRVHKHFVRYPVLAAASIKMVVCSLIAPCIPTFQRYLLPPSGWHSTSTTAVNLHQTTGRNNPADSHLHKIFVSYSSTTSKNWLVYHANK